MDSTVYAFCFFWIVIGISYAQDAPQLTIIPKMDEVIRKVNDGMRFTCQAEGTTADANLKWYNTTGQEIVTSDRVQVEKASPTKLIMSITRVQDGDGGQYTCKGTINGQNVDKSIKMVLYRAISVKNPKHYQTPTIYKDALIECDADANPQPTVEWLYGNRSAVKLGGRYVQEPKGLSIKNITKNDDGLYFCRISIDTIGDMVDFNITVDVTTPPKFESPITHTNPIVTKRFEMTCKATGDPTPKYAFFKGDDTVPLDGPHYVIDKVNGKLVIEKLETSDEARYKCRAENVGGYADEDVFIDVMVPPVIEETTDASEPENTPGTVTCRATGDPAPEISWHKEGMDSPYAKTSQGGGSDYVIEEEVSDLQM